MNSEVNKMKTMTAIPSVRDPWYAIISTKNSLSLFLLSVLSVYHPRLWRHPWRFTGWANFYGRGQSPDRSRHDKMSRTKLNALLISKENAEKLIDIVCKKSQQYDASLTDYKDTLVTKNNWSSVAKEMKIINLNGI